jgi:hypothetical protein
MRSFEKDYWTKIMGDDVLGWNTEKDLGEIKTTNTILLQNLN